MKINCNIVSVLALLIAVMGVAYCLFMRQSSIRYGFVNTEKLMSTFVESQKVDVQVAAERVKWESARSTMQDSLVAFEDRMGRMYDTASVETRKELKSEQIRRMEELGRFEQAMSNGLQKMRTELMTPVYKEINEALAEYAREQGLDVVFASSNGSIVYGDGSKADITDGFVAFLNKRYR